MMPNVWQILVIVVLVVLLFGRGKINGLMADVAQGIKSFKKGMKDEETVAQAAPTPIEAASQPVVKKDEAAQS